MGLVSIAFYGLRYDGAIYLLKSTDLCDEIFETFDRKDLF